MKKRWKAIKRWWRKLRKHDRTFYRNMAIIAGANLIVGCLGSVASLCNVVWISVMIFIYYGMMRNARRSRYYGYLEGKYVEGGISLVRLEYIRKYMLQLREEKENLHSDYKKLQYDYHQLKKQKKQPFKNKKK